MHQRPRQGPAARRRQPGAGAPARPGGSRAGRFEPSMGTLDASVGNGFWDLRPLDFEICELNL